MRPLPVVTSAPVLVLWNYGHWCNMRCLHCYSRPDAEAAACDMTTAEAYAIADQIVAARVMHVHFGGGEPLGRQDLLPVARKLAAAGIAVTLSTNGWLLTERVADDLASLPLETVAFSIHGSDAVSHDSFNRFDGAWTRLVEAVARTVRRGVRTKLVMTLTKPTMPHAVKLVGLAAFWGVYMVQFQSFKRYGNAILDLPALDLDDDGWRSGFADIQQAAERLKADGHPLKVDLGLDSDPVLAARIGWQGKVKRCSCGTYSVTVRPNGDLCACGFAPSYIGNLHERSLLDLWRDDPGLRRIRDTGACPCDF